MTGPDLCSRSSTALSSENKGFLPISLASGVRGSVRRLDSSPHPEKGLTHARHHYRHNNRTRPHRPAAAPPRRHTGRPAGIATSIGVESTARAAYEHGYNVTLVTDAMTHLNAQAHRHSIERIFPLLGESATTAAIIGLLTKTRTGRSHTITR
ncbi:isochorismatase family protein [Nonomuraea dietziae]|uniref:isochorismatase family protein n=1 Tax=Nonomuraea dietziae TaxID=65515 RepID=UPI003418F28E